MMRGVLVRWNPRESMFKVSVKVMSVVFRRKPHMSRSERKLIMKGKEVGSGLGTSALSTWPQAQSAQARR